MYIYINDDNNDDIHYLINTCVEIKIDVIIAKSAYQHHRNICDDI